MSTRHVLAATVLAVVTILSAVDGGPARAATITASYVVGHGDVVINGYGTDGLGMFHLDTGDREERAWCIEADVGHTSRDDAYVAVPSELDVPALDALLWSLARDDVDDDTATAAAALIWYYAGARRTIGPAVWSDGARGFAPVSPTQPHPWDALPRFTLQYQVGLRSGGVDLEAAERRVAELHRWATAHRGPWSIEPGPTIGSFVVRGPGGPIPDVPVRVTVEAAGRDDSAWDVRTAADGSFHVAVPALPDGGRISARVETPGPHRAWDGPGAVQRMVTATTRVVTARTEIPPAPRHVEIHKTSADATLSVEGARFELHDAAGQVAASGTTGPDGRLAFPPVDPAAHPEPYSVVETAPPPGLLAARPVEVGSASSDPADPTIVPVVDHPVLVPVSVRKRLSSPAVGPPDRSGFEFSVTRLADRAVRAVATGADGRTAPVDLPFGRYEICERSRPSWATSLTDTGCRVVDVGEEAAASGGTLEFEYVNEVPSPSIDTRAADAADGDRRLPATGGTAVDTVRLDDLVPGTTYRLAGAMLSAAGESTGVIAELELEASSTSADVELRFEVPPLAPGDYVLVEQLEVAGEVVAVHHRLDDPDQTLTVLAPPETTSTSSTTTTTTTTSTTTSTPTTSTTTEPPVPPTTAPPVPTTSEPTVERPDPTLPRTGSDDAVAAALRLGDLTFVVGVALAAVAGLAPRRRT